MTTAGSLTVALDTTSDIAGVALFDGDALLGEVTWYSRQSHSRDLLPTLDWLLERARRNKSELGAVVVCLGPGSYAGMRVGISTAKALAYGIGVPIVGVGRLAADAHSIAAATTGRVVAVHAAGRAELAWGVYEAKTATFILTLSQKERGSEGQRVGFGEIEPPRLGLAEALIENVQAGDVVCGEVEKLNETVCDALEKAGVRLVESPATRVLSVGRLGLARLARGDVDNAETLVPMYLRAPAIGPQS